ncbi:hypothetical protein EYF80_029976 [Liparis tanakae]|uniref:Uncharacterized protein n=1 Tax=Liparis tanakae TaxID=230148 RepID=A0A4Z2H2I7_9TELE|nr:hypothetical protein EYF80_029976 [Liparis tanakae]
MDEYRAKARRLVSSLPLFSSTLSQKMCSQAYSFSSLMPRSSSLLFFRRSLEYSCKVFGMTMNTFQVDACFNGHIVGGLEKGPLQEQGEEEQHSQHICIL